MILELVDLAGHDLGERTVHYDARDAIIYALAVGSPSHRIDLVYERDLIVLPSFACALETRRLSRTEVRLSDCVSADIVNFEREE